MDPAMERVTRNDPRRVDVTATFRHQDYLFFATNVHLFEGNRLDIEPTENRNNVVYYSCKLVDGKVVLAPQLSCRPPIVQILAELEGTDGVIETWTDGASNISVRLEAETAHAPTINALCVGLRKSGFIFVHVEYKPLLLARR